jgi:hypothetical protein
MYNEYGEFRGCVLINQREWQVHYFDALDTKPSSGNDEFHDALEQFADDPDSVIDLVIYHANRAHYVCNHETVEAAPKFVMTLEPDYGQLRPRLSWLPVDAIKKTFERTTQHTCMPMSTILKKWYKSPNPALNVRPRDEPVATDTIYSDTPAIDCGITSAQLFVGTKTHTADVYSIKSDKQFVNTLLDNITQRGAPTKLISNRAQVEISECVKQVLRPLHISTWQSKPHQQHQNPAERQCQNINRLCNTILDGSGAPAYTLLLCMCASCSTTHGVKQLMISLFACPRVLLMTSVPCYVFNSGNLSTTSLTTATFCLTHVRNVLVEWENGEITSEPLNIFGKDDPVTCAVYACEHGLLEEEGWKRFKGIAKREKKMLRMINQSCIKVTHNAPR